MKFWYVVWRISRYSGKHIEVVSDVLKHQHPLIWTKELNEAQEKNPDPSEEWIVLWYREIDKDLYDLWDKE